MAQDFIKNQEDFVCEHCGQAVAGTGYTNHCPECLWSKHVDIHPGDRACPCGGLMRPVGYEKSAAGYDLEHECEGCGVRKRNKLAPNDNLARLAEI